MITFIMIPCFMALFNNFPSYIIIIFIYIAQYFLNSILSVFKKRQKRYPVFLISVCFVHNCFSDTDNSFFQQ